MGTILHTLKTCFCFKNQNQKNEGKKINIEKLSDINFDNIPDDEFYCCKCDQIPEILNIFSDNNKIQYICKKCGLKEKNLKEYFQEVSKSVFTYLRTCDNLCSYVIDKKNILQYCPICKKNLCTNCIKKFDPETKGHLKEHINSVIAINEKSDYCVHHYAYKNNYFCFDCKKNICAICSKDVHKLHDYEKINYSDIQNYVNIINKKNKKLLKTIEFIKLVIQRYNDQSEFGEENLETTSTCIQNENKRDCLLMDLAVYKLRMEGKYLN